MNLFKKLAALATDMDRAGFHKTANRLDRILASQYDAIEVLKRKIQDLSSQYGVVGVGAAQTQISPYEKQNTSQPPTSINNSALAQKGNTEAYQKAKADLESKLNKSLQDSQVITLWKYSVDEYVYYIVANKEQDDLLGQTETSKKAMLRTANDDEDGEDWDDTYLENKPNKDENIAIKRPYSKLVQRSFYQGQVDKANRRPLSYHDWQGEDPEALEAYSYGFDPKDHMNLLLPEFKEFGLKEAKEMWDILGTAPELKKHEQ